VQKQISYNFLKSLYVKDKRIAQIEAYHQQLGTAVDSFQVRLLPSFNGFCDTQPISQISALLNVQDWQSKNNDARIADQESLNHRFDELQANHHELVQALGMVVFTATSAQLRIQWHSKIPSTIA
jgi:hypothetical protein